MNVKIKKEFWNLIAKGQKVLEFRKLESKIPTGVHIFVSIETIGDVRDSFDPCDNCLNCAGNEICWKNDGPNEIYGFAHWKPVAVNPLLFKGYADAPSVYIHDMHEDHSELRGSYDHIIDFDTYEFVQENYISKGIDFIAYELTDVKVGINE